MTNEESIDLLKLDNNDFEQKIINLSNQKKDDLLFLTIDGLWSCDKLKILLAQGANPMQFIGEEKIMLWTIAFSRDKIADQKELYLSLLLPYLFDNFTEEFKQGVQLIEKNSLNEYKVIINRGNMAYKSVGYENNKIEEKLNTEYTNILNDFEKNVEQLNESSLLNLKLKNKSKFKIVK